MSGQIVWVCGKCNNRNIGGVCINCNNTQQGTMAGFMLNGLDATQLVEHLSRCAALTDVLKAAADMYGFELVIDEEVATRMRARAPEDVFYPERWTRDAEGNVTRERMSIARMPQWAQDDVCSKRAPT